MEATMYNQMPYRKRIPYGMMNFVDVREDDCYFVDKTVFIPALEAANKFFFFIRPRRFGKSLTISMLRHYYDVLDKENFEKWYGGLYIGQHPTPKRNSYLVIYLNFAVVNAELSNYRQSLDAHCDTKFCAFCDDYADLLPADIKSRMKEKNGAVEQLDFLVEECRKAGLAIYLFIDEYDHFTNKILSEPVCLNDYKTETHGTGYLRSFFDTVKAGTDSSIKRVFVTGVSPVTMDDLTSGFNIGTNYSLSPEFNELVGFTEEDVRAMLDYYATTCEFHHTTDELIAIMKPWYDNYCFAEERYGHTTLYNSNMVLYFVDNYIRCGCEIPKRMIEENIRVDYNKLRMLIRKDREFAHDASLIQTIVQQGYITGNLKTGFPAEQITDPDNFISLLYYFGMLTIDGTVEGDVKLSIPNQVVREQIYSYLLATYEENGLEAPSREVRQQYKGMAFRGLWQDFFTYTADCIKTYSSQRDKQKGEAFVHGFTLAMTAQNPFYRPVSEQDTQEGYVDLFLKPLVETYPDMKHSYVIELKYAKSKESAERVDQLRQQAIKQVSRYASSGTIQTNIGHTQLHKIVVVFHGVDMAVCEEIFGASADGFHPLVQH